MVALATTHPQTAAIRTEIVAVLSRIYLPRCQLSGWEWCERHIILDPEESRDNHGPYSTAETLYVRRVFEFITRPDEREMIIMKSAQLGFTLAYMLIVCYVAATAPTHVLYAMHSGKKAKEISTRLQRLLTRNRSLAETLLGEPEETLHNLLLKLRGMMVVLTGSGSAGEFDAASFGLVILDELDRHVAGARSTGQANTIDLARDRIKEVATGKLLAGGTPEEGTSETVTNWQTGTREQLEIQCPACATWQAFDFERLEFRHCKDERGEWDYARVHREAAMRCARVDCTHRFANSDKRSLLQPERIRWVATNHGQDEHKPFPGRVSLHINDLYSLRDQTTWGHIACQWIDAQKSPSKLRRFWNRVLGCPPPDRTVHLTSAAIKALAGGYDHGCMPLPPAMSPSGAPAIILYADQQATCLKWVKAGFSPTGECWIIDYGMCLTRDDLLDIAARPVCVGLHYPDPVEMEAARVAALEASRPLVEILRERHPGTWHSGILVGGIDEGNGAGGETVDTRRWCLSTGMLFFPTKGSDARSVHDLVVARTNKFFVDEQPVTVYHFCDADMKTELYISRIAEAEKIRSGESEVPALHLPAQPTQDFCEELSQERRDHVVIKGKRIPMWIEPTGANDWGDAVKGCLVMWHTVKAVFAAPSPPEMDTTGRILRPALPMA
jgi:phage terminase large subunit GpA-like protein